MTEKDVKWPNKIFSTQFFPLSSIDFIVGSLSTHHLTFNIRNSSAGDNTSHWVKLTDLGINTDSKIVIFTHGSYYAHGLYYAHQCMWLFNVVTCEWARRSMRMGVQDRVRFVAILDQFICSATEQIRAVSDKEIPAGTAGEIRILISVSNICYIWRKSASDEFAVSFIIF